MINKIKILFVSILLLSGVSCKTDESTIENMSTMGNIQSSAKTYNNIGNPYEYVGQHHNAFLDFYMQQNSPEDLNDIIEMARQFFQNQYALTLPDSISNQEVATNVTYSIEHSISENIMALKNAGSISDLTYNYLAQLANIVENPADDEDLNDFVNKIENLEKTLLLANLTGADKEILLSVISVAKYSANYWKEVYGSSENIALKGEPSTWTKVKIAIHVAGVDLNAQIKASLFLPPGLSGIYATIASSKEQSRIDKIVNQH